MACACVAFAVAYNRLDVGSLAGNLAEDVVYGSQEALDDLSGKSEVLDYISGKFETVRAGGLECRVRAELAVEPVDGDPCILLHQRNSKYQEGLGDPVAYANLESNDAGQIRRITLVSLVPSPADCDRTGLFPGILPTQIKRDKQPPRLILPRDAEISFKLFVWPGSELCRAMQQSVEKLLGSEKAWSLRVLDILTDVGLTGWALLQFLQAGDATGAPSKMHVPLSRD